MATRWRYRCEAVSVDGFIHQLVRHVRNGYVFYVVGEIPEGKDPEQVDANLLKRYGIDVPPWTRSRRPSGSAAVHYIRYKRTFVMLANYGVHPFFDEEGYACDMREQCFRYGSYSMSYLYSTHTERWHVSVRIERDLEKRLRTRLTKRASTKSVESMVSEFRRLPFYPFAPVRRQLIALLKRVNEARRAAGLRYVPVSALRLRPWPVPVFEDSDAAPCEVLGGEVEHATT